MKDYHLLKFVKSDEELEEMFLHSFRRKVALDATIPLYSKLFEVPQKYIKQEVTVKFFPNSLDIAYIYLDGKKVETIYPVNKIDNSKIKRKAISYSSLEDNA